MGQCSSLQVDSRSNGQEINRLLWNQKCHYRFHNSPTLDHILSHLNPVHSSTSDSLKIHISIFLQYRHTPRFPKWPLLIRFSTKILIEFLISKRANRPTHQILLACCNMYLIKHKGTCICYYTQLPIKI